MLIWLKKVEHCKKGKIKKNIHNFLKTYMIMQKTIIKFGNIEIQNQKFHQHKRPISFKIIDINKIVVCNKVSFVKKRSKYFIGYNNAKKIERYVYFSQKWVHI